MENIADSQTAANPPAKRPLTDVDTNTATMTSPLSSGTRPQQQQQLQQLQPLLVKRLSEHARVPVRSSAGAVGYDLCAAANTVVPARGKAVVPTDIAVAIPAGCYGRVAPRSGLAAKNFIDVGAGVIDPDYRGNLGVVLFNHAEVAFEIRIGDRIAQLVLEVALTPTVVEVAELDATERGGAGYGSTGVRS